MPSAEDIYRAQPTQAEIEDLLGQRLTAAVATKNPDGSIHLAYVIFLYENGKMYWETASSTRKARNLAVRPTTSFLVDGDASSGTSLMVSGSGSGELLIGSHAEEINQRLRAKYVTDEAIGVVNDVWGSFDDVCVEVTVDKWRSWTNQVFREATLDGFGDSPPERLWRG
jgi:hypothetical protein